MAFQDCFFSRISFSLDARRSFFPNKNQLKRLSRSFCNSRSCANYSFDCDEYGKVNAATSGAPFFNGDGVPHEKGRVGALDGSGISLAANSRNARLAGANDCAVVETVTGVCLLCFVVSHTCLLQAIWLE